MSKEKLIAEIAEDEIKYVIYEQDEKSEYKEAILDIDLAVSNGDQELLNSRLESALRKLRQPKAGGHSGR